MTAYKLYANEDIVLSDGDGGGRLAQKNIPLYYMDAHGTHQTALRVEHDKMLLISAVAHLSMLENGASFYTTAEVAGDVSLSILGMTQGARIVIKRGDHIANGFVVTID